MSTRALTTTAPPRVVDSTARVVSARPEARKPMTARIIRSESDEPKPQPNPAPSTPVTTKPPSMSVPGGDAFGNVFKLLTIVGLAGLAVFHPQYIATPLNKAVGIVTTVIRGE